MRRARIDSGQTAIVAALRAGGASVHSLATVGRGCPDLVVGFLGITELAEVKSPGGKFTGPQSAWLSRWRGNRVWILVTPHDAALMLEHMRQSAKPARDG